MPRRCVCFWNILCVVHQLRNRASGHLRFWVGWCAKPPQGNGGLTGQKPFRNAKISPCKTFPERGETPKDPGARCTLFFDTTSLAVRVSLESTPTQTYERTTVMPALETTRRPCKIARPHSLHTDSSVWTGGLSFSFACTAAQRRGYHRAVARHTYVKHCCPCAP